jgi:hypothetical protein
MTPPKGKALFSSVTFSISAQGDLNQLLHFLHQLESGAHYCRINSATINISGAKRDSPLTLALSLELLGHP